MVKEAIKGKQDTYKCGCIKALATTFDMDQNTAKILLEGETAADIASRNKENVNDTRWPEIIEQFCLAKPICREAPGETVSIEYGKRAEKYIRQFSV